MTDKKLTDGEIIKACNNCLHYEACKGTYYSAKGDEDILYDFDGEMYANSGCEDFQDKDLINRQKAIIEKSEKVEHFADKAIETANAEIENLKVENQSLRSAANSLKMHYEEARTKIESLKIFRGYAEKRESDYKTMRDKYLNAKSEAYKEFAERLKEQAEVYTDSAEDVFILAVGISKIDNLLKELMGENND